MRIRVEFRREHDGAVSRSVSNGSDIIVARSTAKLAFDEGVNVDSAALLDEAELEAAGAKVLSAAFGLDGPALLEQLRRSAGFSGTPLEIEIFENADIPDTRRIPWELMHDGSGFLGASPGIHLVRRPVEEEITTPLHVSACPQLLYCWSRPPGAPDLEMEREQISLEWALARAKSDDRIKDYELSNTTFAEFEEFIGLPEIRPDIILFSGHGDIDLEGNTCLIFEDRENSGGKKVRTSEFVRRLAALCQRHRPHLIYLSACHSGAVAATSGEADQFAGDRDREKTVEVFRDLARQLSGIGIPHVIGTATAVYDTAAQVIASVLLPQLLRQESFDVPAAVAEARSALLNREMLPEAVRRSFYQFQHFSVCPTRPEVLPIDETGELQEIVANSGEFTSHLANRIRRNRVLLDLRRAYSDRGQRSVGLQGTGGMGKTWVSFMLLDSLRKGEIPGMQFDALLWIDLRTSSAHGADNPGYAAGSRIGFDIFRSRWVDVIRRAARMMTANGRPRFPSAAPAIQHLEQQSCSPRDFARLLQEVFGPRSFVVLDNCETLLDCGNRFYEPTVAESLEALFGETQWRLLFTSRQRFSLDRDGRDLAPIDWRIIPSFERMERLAYIWRREQSSTLAKTLHFDNLDKEQRTALVEKVAPVPYSLNLFYSRLEQDNLADPKEIATRAEAANAKAADYAWLGYYVESLPQSWQRLLQLCAIIAEPELPRLIAYYMKAFHDYAKTVSDFDWPDIEKPDEALNELFNRALLVIEVKPKTGHEGYGVLPVLGGFLLSPQAPDPLDKAQTKQVIALLAHATPAVTVSLQPAFYTYFEDTGIKTIVPELPEGGLPRVGAILEARTTLIRGIRFSLKVESIRLAGILLGALLQGLVPRLLEDEGESLSSALSDLIKKERQKFLDANDSGDPSKAVLDTWIMGLDLVGRTLVENRLYFKALETYQQILSLIDGKQTLSRHQGMRHNRIGQIHLEQRQWPEAVAAYEKALEWAKKTGEKDELAITFSHLGIVYQKQRHWAEALAANLKAVELFKGSGKAHQLGSTYHQIGRLHEDQRQWPEALTAYEQALEWHEKTEQPHELGITYAQLMLLFAAKAMDAANAVPEDWESAAEYGVVAFENFQDYMLHMLGQWLCDAYSVAQKFPDREGVKGQLWMLLEEAFEINPKLREQLDRDLDAPELSEDLAK